MTARALMFQGTGSDVGKSLIVAGLCRALARRGVTVRPFKPQNMSNNAAVTPAGGEIGRAQALQALACGAEPCADMNPVLLKPQSEKGAQVVVHGAMVGSAEARDYHAWKPRLLPKVLESFDRLAEAAEVILVEGAGSPAEINLRDGDIANMGFAESRGVPVVLVADISRGGAIAALVGTWHLMTEGERDLTKGFLINKFRGDPALFDDGAAEIVSRTGWRNLGVVPWFAEARRLPAEDAVALERPGPAAANGAIRVAVLVLTRVANFDDFDPLAAEPDVSVTFVHGGTPLPADADLVVLPGTKSTLADLRFLRAQGWDIDLLAHLRRGGTVLGVCGGYQMLGTTIEDRDGIEGTAGRADGLGLLDVATVMTPEKALKRVCGRDAASGAAVRGYEMHIGRTEGPDAARPMLDLDGRPDGARSADGRVLGCYVHGLFAADGFRHAFLGSLKARRPSALDYDAEVGAVLDRLADHLEAHGDVDAMLACARPTGG